MSLIAGNRYAKEGKINEAIEEYQKIVSSSPLYHTAQFNIAYLKKKNSYIVSEEQQLLLSIIVPVYNTEKYLKKCLESIINQELKEFELVVINDGSTDSSLQIINELMQKDSRIKLINNQFPSGNPGTPRNQGIQLSKGLYIGFVDSDDWIDPNMYSELIKKAQSENSDIVFSSGFKNHMVTGEVDVRKYDHSFFMDKENKYYRYHESFMIWDKIFKSDVVKNNDIKLGETKAAVDVPFIFKAYYYAEKISFCDSLFAYNYRRESDTSVTVNFRKGSDCNFELIAYENIARWANDEKVDDRFMTLINIKKLSSYIYTLKIIAPDMFSQFYEKVQNEIQNIKRNDIDDFTIIAKKRYMFKAYEDICKLSDVEYMAKYREDYRIKGTFEIMSKRKGILFFPEWTYSNPYQKLMYTEISKKYGVNIIGYKPEFFTKEILERNRFLCDYVHLHWLHVFMNLENDNGIDLLLENIIYAKSLGYKFIYTGHNIISHDTNYYEREKKFRKTLLKEFEYILVHGRFAKEKIINELGADERRVFIIEHGTYGSFYPNTISRDDARNVLNIKTDDFVFLFLGNIKGYKGIEPLLNAFDNVRKKHSNAKLIIAGKVADEKSKVLLEKAVKHNSGLIYKPGFVKDTDVQIYFNASDIMVLPYKQILTSGAALLSMTFDKPVIAPNTGLLPELITEEQGFLFDSFGEMESIMNECVRSLDSNKFRFKNLNEELSWAKLINKEPFSNMFKLTSENVK